MESTQQKQAVEAVATLEIRLPWGISSAWQTVLSQTPLDVEATKDFYFQLNSLNRVRFAHADHLYEALS
ncbi:hypothetical protein [Pseudomonas sp. BBP2017]|uniref:hypothetical protein n=1 Tax=Pseudomonas sp. BBP2017 TaxID=2109731 RepID=UPI000D1385D3|nr:hypothetical protein [Pseudomonas sp. BBP2017]PSS56946.1 hypothetical protein C6382_12580 [Pseudomonas sp. BBP2017]